MKTIFYTITASAVIAGMAAPVGAAVLDLTTAGASGTINGGMFQQISPQSTGTGVIDPFVRIQDNVTEDGFNTGLSQQMPDVKAGTWTHEILVSAIPIVNIGGIDYYQFLLDINQNSGGNNERLTLFELEIYTKTGTLPEANDYSDLAGATKVWDMDSGADGDSKIEMNYELNNGSGSGDMFAYIPVTAIGTDGTKNLYLYSAFGSETVGGVGLPYPSNDGFEEWAVLKAGGTTTVPDAGSSVSLLGMALLGIAALRRRLS